MIRRVASTSISPTLNIYLVVTAQIVSKSIQIPIFIKSDNERESIKTLGLIDSGAGGEFIDQYYAKKSSYKIKKLDKLLQALNVDGTWNKRGTIMSFIELTVKINRRQMDLQLLVMGLGKQKIILGFPWLHEQNPDINWKTGDFSWQETKNHSDSSKSRDTIHANHYSWQKSWQDKHSTESKKKLTRKRERTG